METMKVQCPDNRMRLHDAAQLHQSNDFAAAEEIYNDLLAENPQDPQVLCLLGLLSLETGCYDASVDYYRKAQTYQPRCADTHLY